jgi:hypothetical protein
MKCNGVTSISAGPSQGVGALPPPMRRHSSSPPKVVISGYPRKHGSVPLLFLSSFGETRRSNAGRSSSVCWNAL